MTKLGLGKPLCFTLVFLGCYISHLNQSMCELAISVEVGGSGGSASGGSGGGGASFPAASWWAGC